MSEKNYTSKTVLREGKAPLDIFSIDSMAEDNLSLFLTFTGLVGGVPIYYLFCSLILRIAKPNLYMGALLAFIFACLGFLIRKLSRKKVTVQAADNGKGGTISVKDGLFGPKISYAYGPEAKIRLSVSELASNGRDVENWEITLIDGRYYYLLDSRCDRLQESRALAEFLVKSLKTVLVFVADAGHLVEMTWQDVDLPYYIRVKKYPDLQKGHPVRPEVCPVEIEDFDGGTGRRYSWSFFSGMASGILSLAVLTGVFSLLPLFGEVGKRVSLFSMASRSGNWSFFFGAAIVFAAVFLIQAGLSNRIEISGERVNLCNSFFGFNYRIHSMLLEELEGVIARKSSGSSGVVFASDRDVYSLRMASPAIAEYVAADIQYFLVMSKTYRFAKNP